MLLKKKLVGLKLKKRIPKEIVIDSPLKRIEKIASVKLLKFKVKFYADMIYEIQEVEESTFLMQKNL